MNNFQILYDYFPKNFVPKNNGVHSWFQIYKGLK